MTTATTILIVDDEQSMRSWLSICLRKTGYAPRTAADGYAALEMLREDPADVVITDVRMPRLGGIELLREIKRIDPTIVVIIMTAFGTPETARLVKEFGAYDYLTKPFKIDEIELVVGQAVEHVQLTRENERLRQELDVHRAGVIARSAAMTSIMALVQRVAELTSTVLITGESGTGKELIARSIHTLGPRREGPFVAVNCAALPDTLLESELFGHERGAFTGAVDQRKGKFELAKGGTIFLDEIGDMNLATQAKVLRVLQDKRFSRLGGSRELVTDARIVAATNKDLEEAVASGNFREDLFYRLNVIPIHLPPLRDRPEDIPLLLNHFLKMYGPKVGREGVVFEPQAQELLERYHWPGNVRELSNIVERALVLAEGNRIGPEVLPRSIQCGGRTSTAQTIVLPLRESNLDDKLHRLERDYLLAALEHAKGVKVEAAKALGISFRSLRYRLNKHHLD